jgi:hypothetical protein
MKAPRKLSLVKVSPAVIAELAISDSQVYLFLGEIPNMPGHCVIAEYPTGRVISGLHTERVRELKINEV